jgi:hypothetical protein
MNRLLFWSAFDMGRTLSDFKDFYNEHRTHASLEGWPPAGARNAVASLDRYRWQTHCRGLYQTPIAA